MTRTAPPFEDVAERSGVEPGLERRRIDLVDRGVKDGVNAERVEPVSVLVEGPGIFVEVFVGAELGRVDEDTDDDAPILAARAGDQAVVARMQRAHGRHHADIVPGVPPGDRLLLHRDRRLVKPGLSGRSTRAQGWGRRRCARPDRIGGRRLRSPLRVWRTGGRTSRRGPGSARGRPG